MIIKILKLIREIGLNWLISLSLIGGFVHFCTLVFNLNISLSLGIAVLIVGFNILHVYNFISKINKLIESQ